ncbi:MAG: hypothetical protein KDA37_10025 [Planctomycetales bacterium]|nr:hypothetical protein [Planctomycetales bacterium]
MSSVSKDPPMTLPGARPLSQQRAPWYLVYTQPRQEKALARELVRLEAPYFLPLLTNIVTGGGRRRKHLNPLFPSYVFASLDGDKLRFVQDSSRVLQCLPVPEPQQAAFSADIERVATVLREHPHNEIRCAPAPPGDAVRITAGGLRGVEGVGKWLNDRVIVWVGIAAINIGIEIELDRLDVEDIA